MAGQGENVTFTNASGERLAARLDLPGGTPRAFALFAHCFTCSKDIFAASRLSQGLAERGLAVLRFDFTGLGASEGEFASTNFSSNVEDLLSAADFLRQAYAAPSILIGHSLGGAAVLAAAGQVSEAVAVATIVRLRHERIHATDCEDCETKEGKLDQIERALELTGSLDAAARQRLLEIADKCPVHRTLTGEVKIRTKLIRESDG